MRNSRSVFFVLAAAAAIAMAGCSGGRSALPGTPSAPLGAQARPEHFSHPFSHLKNGAYPGSSMAYLLTDGTVLAQGGGGTYYRYAPDAYGSYSDGTWTQVASLPSGYDPDAAASDVLADGRFVITGGEYNSGRFDLTNLGAIYDPVANTWTALGHPKKWGWIGDSPSSVLPDGRLLLGQKLTKRDAYLDPKTLQWVNVGDAGKNDFNAEEGFTLLPDGTILTADVKKDPDSEIYNPSTGQWKSGGSTIVDLAMHWTSHSCLPYGPKPKDCYYPPGEIGPSILRPDGTVFYTGAGSGASGYGAGHTAIYHTTGGTWSTGPDFPNGDNAGDSFALLEPSGNVLVFGDSGATYEWNGSTFTQTSLSWQGPPLLLPTGQVLMLGNSAVSLYTPAGSPKASWAPKIKSYPKTIASGKTYKITGMQFNGLSQAMSFGDEYQNATNYPLVRITNTASTHVFYARTHDHSTMGVATGSKLVWTYFDVPSGIESGASTLVVVANGIASKPVSVTVSGARARTRR